LRQAAANNDGNFLTLFFGSGVIDIDGVYVYQPQLNLAAVQLLIMIFDTFIWFWRQCY
jgi:hypothetical protein